MGVEEKKKRELMDMDKSMVHDLAYGSLSDLTARLGIFVPVIPSALNTLHKAFTSHGLLFTCHCRKVFPTNSIRKYVLPFLPLVFYNLPCFIFLYSYN